MARVLIDGVGDLGESWEKIFAGLNARIERAEVRAEKAEKDHATCKQDWLQLTIRCASLEQRVRELELGNGKVG